MTDVSQPRSAVDDLDDEVMSSVRQNNKNVKSFFEASAPKYKFGGSMTNISASTEEVRQRTKRKTPPIVTSGDSRSWVLSSINKHFDVIVEDEEDGSLSEDSDDETSDEDEDSLSEEEEDDEQPLKVSDHMRNIFKSVVCQITEREERLNNEDILSNLKHKLETYTSSS